MQNAKALVEQFLGSNTGGDQGGGGQSTFSLDKLLTGYGGVATGAAAGGLAGLLMGGGKPKKIAETALTVGGVALVGGLAYKAYRNWQANKDQSGAGISVQSQARIPDETAFLPNDSSEREALARTLVRAMVAAAKADGTITEAEKSQIASQLQAIQLGDSDRQFIERELASPLNIDAVVQSARTPEQAVEIYTASLLAINENGRAERGYLALLSARLDLDPALVEHVHASTNAAMEKNAA